MNTPYQDTVDSVLVNTSSTWESLSLIRLAILIILSIVLLSALTKPGKIVVVHDVATVPLSYENDAKGG
jgi:hypothetical protein